MNFTKTYWKSIIAVIAISYLSLIRTPSPKLILPIVFFDKLAHAAMYLGLSFVLTWDFLGDKIAGWKSALGAILIASLYGGVIEILQENFFKPRTGDWFDWSADVLGAILGCTLCMVLHKKGWLQKMNWTVIKK